KQRVPIVIKADGLAAGKGSIIAASREEAVHALRQIMQDRVFGAAGDRVVIEEYLSGKEVSLVAVTDGTTVAPFMPACDYKKAGDNDTGLNTGGMGAYCPPGFFARADIGRATGAILEPTVRALAAEGIVFHGVLYAGLMVSPDGIRTLEFNARFGDPETQVTLPLLKSDIVEVFLAAIEGRLDKLRIDWYDSACVGVVIASAGYPGDYRTGFPIAGLDNLDRDVLVFHAGTRLGEDGKSVHTGGGRVLNVVATGKTLAEAREKVYSNIGRISFEGAYYRRDIAAREVC
ncbi:MAG: phosphoribosylamine--glycine ligase, partial [Chloroflexota bacterium]